MRTRQISAYARTPSSEVEYGGTILVGGKGDRPAQAATTKAHEDRVCCRGGRQCQHRSIGETSRVGRAAVDAGGLLVTDPLPVPVLTILTLNPVRTIENP